MEFNETYFKARAEAIKWLNVEPRYRDYASGVAILGRMGFKPLLHRRLSMHQSNPTLLVILDQALRDSCNIYQAPNDPYYADTIPAELEVMDAGTHQAPKEEKEATEGCCDTATNGTGDEDGNESPKFAAYPETVKTVTKWFSKAYKLRAAMHRHLREIGNNNDDTSVARRKQLSDQINALSDYMDKLFPLKAAYDRHGTIPTKEEVDAIGPMEAQRNAVQADPEKVDDSDSSLKNKNEDFSSMSKDDLRRRKHSTRTLLMKKKNQLLYQSNSIQEKENPMPFSPERTKIEVQVGLLQDKLYNIDKALARFG